MSAEDQPLVMEYSSSTNISFRGTIVLDNITLAEYRELSTDEQNELIADELNNLVDIYVVDH